MYDNFKIANYNNSLVSPEFYAKPLSRLFSGDVIDGLTVVPGTGLQVTLQPGNTFLRYGSAAVASARIVSLIADFNLAIPTPDASNPRIDLVVIYVDTAVNLPVVDASNPPTNANLDGPGVAKAKIVSGTPAATPVAPNAGAIQSSVGASNPYTVVGQVLVDKAPVSVIASGKITDVRKRTVVGVKNLEPGIERRIGVQKKSVTSILSATYLTLASVSGLSNGGECEASFAVRAANAGSGAVRHLYVRIQRDGVTVGSELYVTLPLDSTNDMWLTISFMMSDTPVSGNHVWDLQARGSVASAVRQNEAYLKVTEIGT